MVGEKIGFFLTVHESVCQCARSFVKQHGGHSLAVTLRSYSPFAVALTLDRCMDGRRMEGKGDTAAAQALQSWAIRCLKGVKADLKRRGKRETETRRRELRF